MADNISPAASHKRLPLGRLHEVKQINSARWKATHACTFCGAVDHNLQRCPQLPGLGR
jgi:hypothetical protein